MNALVIAVMLVSSACGPGGCTLDGPGQYSGNRLGQMFDAPGQRYYVPSDAVGGHQSVMKISCPDRDGKVSHGTAVGVMFNDVPVIVTNWHNVQDAVDPGAATIVDGAGRSHSVKFVGADKLWDVAVYYSPTVTKRQTCSYDPSRPLTLRERVFIFGYGRDRRLAWSAGLLGQPVAPASDAPFELREVNNVLTVQGDSGGPVIAGNRLIGITRLGNERNMAVIVTIPRVCQILRALGIGPQAKWYVLPQPPVNQEPVRGPPLAEVDLDLTNVDAAMASMAESSRIQADAVAAYLHAQTEQIRRQQDAELQGAFSSSAEAAASGWERAGVRGAAADVMRNEQVQDTTSNVLLWVILGLLAVVPGGQFIGIAARAVVPWFVRAGARTFANLLDTPQRNETDEAVAAAKRAAKREDENGG